MTTGGDAPRAARRRFAQRNGLKATIHIVYNFFKERKQVLHDG
ncbi:hypothetical protein [Paraburkholderia sp. BL27I4N3]|nr:hypothetical protein [Paraburkholderia sp. BL27I4N3]